MPKLRIALPKGRLLNGVLHRFNYSFKFKNDRDYCPVCKDSELSAKVVKTRAIPQLLALGQFTLGFAGLDLIKESGYDNIKPILDLKLNPVKLVVAGPKGLPGILKELPNRPLLIATEYENIAHEWAMNLGLAHIVIQTWGSTEAYPPDDADIIIDNVDSGATLKANNLHVIEEIMNSTTHLVVNSEDYEDPIVKRKVDRIAESLVQ